MNIHNDMYMYVTVSKIIHFNSDDIFELLSVIHSVCVDSCCTVYVDINECDSSDACPQDSTCVNTDGSFQCNCNDGFTMTGAECEGKGNLVN